jgi:ABC-type multidrug transport system permease subunit
VQVCQVLKKVANAGASVLFTIHQPSSEIFDSFDHLILLHKGRVLFQGSVRSVPSFFGARGHPCPLTYNPADWIIHVAQKYPVEMLERTGFFPKDSRNNILPSIRDDDHDELGEQVSPSDELDMRPPHWRTQVRLLFHREFVYMYRYSTPQKARFGLTAFLSTLIGMIFFKVGETSPADSFNLQSQFGAVMILLMLAMLGTAQPAILCFPEERPIFLREYSTKHYSVFSYFISRLFIEMVNTAIQVFIMVTIIHSMVGFRGSYENFFLITFALAMTATAMAVTLGVLAGGDVGVAQQLIPIIFIPQLLFSGFFVATDLIPKILRWAQSLCVLTYAVRLLLVEEFYNCSDNSLELANCNYLLASTKSDVEDTFSNWMILLCQFVVWRCIALFLLRKSATKFY